MLNKLIGGWLNKVATSNVGKILQAVKDEFVGRPEVDKLYFAQQLSYRSHLITVGYKTISLYVRLLRHTPQVECNKEPDTACDEFTEAALADKVYDYSHTKVVGLEDFASSQMNLVKPPKIENLYSVLTNHYVLVGELIVQKLVVDLDDVDQYFMEHVFDDNDPVWRSNKVLCFARFLVVASHCVRGIFNADSFQQNTFDRSLLVRYCELVINDSAQRASLDGAVKAMFQDGLDLSTFNFTKVNGVDGMKTRRILTDAEREYLLAGTAVSSEGKTKIRDLSSTQ